MITKLISSVKQSQRKKKVVKTILSSPHKEEGIVNMHRHDTKNVGDYYCAPHHYFEELRNSSLDIFDYRSNSDEVTSNFIEKICSNNIIVGGGGLLNRGGFRRQLEMCEALSQKKKVVLWGIGHNSHEPGSFGKVSTYNVDVNKFGLAGTRDYSMPGQWVPCVSCLHPIFNEDYEETQETGVIFHKDTLEKPNVLEKFKDFPSTSNITELESLISFIGKSSSIITDSYHAMYWAILMRKKVVVVPNSSKFYDFKYPPVISTFDDCISDLKKAKSYKGVLEECREINKSFANQVFDYLLN